MPIIDKNIPYTINLMGGRDWSKFKKWYIRLSLRKYLKSKDNPVIISSNWELSEGLIQYKDKLLIMSKLRKAMIHIDYLMGNNLLQSTLNKE